MLNQLDSSTVRRLLAGIAAVLFAVGIWGLGGQGASAATHQVQAKDFAFVPSELTIAVGDTVTWTNGDAESHAVQGGSVTSPEIVAGGSFSHTFSVAGEFAYFCRFHTYMTGTVHVGSGGAAATTTAPPASTTPTTAPPSTPTTTAGTIPPPAGSPTQGSTFQEVPDDPSARRPPGESGPATSSVAVASVAATVAATSRKASATVAAAVHPVTASVGAEVAAGAGPPAGAGSGHQPLVAVSAEVHGPRPSGTSPSTGGASLGDGTQLAASTTVGGVKEFRLSMDETTIEVSPGVVKPAYAFNGVVPGPVLRAHEGERVRIIVENKLPFATSTHWHGMILPNDQDGVGELTQPSIQPGETYTYEWTAVATGTHWYHAHSSGRHIGKGLYGPLEVVPAKGDLESDRDYRLMLGDSDLGFVLNGRSFPSTPTLEAEVGETVRLRVINTGDQVHAMHLHGVPFTVAAQDGIKKPSPEGMDTLTIAPGQTFDLLFSQVHPGRWLVHCHMFIHSHMSGDSHPPGETGMTGMVAIVNTVPATDDGGFDLLPISTVELPRPVLVAVLALIALAGSVGSSIVARRIRQS